MSNDQLTSADMVFRRLAPLSVHSLTLAAVVQLVAGVITSKLAATMLGPTGVGTYALVQATANIVALCALGTGEALVREWGRRRADSSPAHLAAMMRGAELAGLAALGLIAIVAMALSRPLTSALFGPGRQEMFLLAVAAGITFGWITLQINTMVVRRQVARVGLALALAAASTPVVALFGFRRWGVDGIALVHLLAMLASLVTTGLLVSTSSPAPAVKASVRTAVAEAPALLRYGVPHVLGTFFTASMLLIVPVVVGWRLGVDGAGFYRAAATIAAGMATLFTFDLNGDFSARIAEAATDTEQFADAMGRQLRQLLFRGIVVVAVLSLAAPLLVPILYDQGFDPTTRMLPLILVGQLLGLVAMTLNVGIGARYGGGWLLLNAAIGGAATVVAVSSVDSLAQVGIAFVAGQTIFLLSCAASTLIRDGWAPIVATASHQR